MYTASTPSTTSGSGGRICNGGSELSKGGERRIRVVRLLRPRRPTPVFGFSLRGGREHAAGFFVSKVEFNSEAHHQGLKVGDQLVSVNGFRVDDAIHSELVHYLAAQTRLKIKVRNVGMIPVKEKAHESLSWQFVSESESLSSAASTSPTLCHDTERLADLRISLLVPPRAKLGCGICKGPEWKPGIFVQFVRDGGIARDAGLRPGDQVLSCNGVDFADITFNDAISSMKETGRLELTVRPGAGIELVSPESSGYNSSASSAAGERSPAPPAPPSALRRRLASVAEEVADRADRLTLNRLKRRTWDSLDFDWKNKNMHNFDAPSDIEPDYDSPSIPNNPHTYENFKNNLDKKQFVSSPSNRTIINLTENGATIQCSYENKSPSKTTYSTSKDSDKKTIVVEVHHTSCPQNNSKDENRSKIENNSKKDICPDTSSLSSSSTFSSAIIEEIKRRKMKQSSVNQQHPILPNANKKNNVPKVDFEKQKQHDALMDEFKKVHRKMFANQVQGRDIIVKDGNGEGPVDRQQTLPIRKLQSSSIVNGDNYQQAKNTETPPPPPPMPIINGHIQKEEVKNSQVQKEVRKELNGVNSSNNTTHAKGTIKRFPTPDYETNKIENLTAQLKLINHSKDDLAEMESLESYKLKNPSSPQIKPPSTYFSRAPNGTATMKKHARPVSVTIGEYACGGGARKEPSKLDFLNCDTKTNGVDATDNVPISNRLQSELALTLSRSNLRKKTDSLNRNVGSKIIIDKIDKREEINESSLDKNFHARYGNNMLPVPPAITIPKVSGFKHCPVSNNVHIQKQNTTKCINGNYNHNGTVDDTSSGTRIEDQKRISFDHMLMVAGDK